MPKLRRCWVARNIHSAWLALSTWLAATLLILTTPSIANAKPHVFDKVAGSAGSVLNFLNADVNLSPGYAIPENGWKRSKFIGVRFHNKTRQRDSNFVAWYKVRFDPRNTGSGPLAFETDHTADRIILYLNGVDVYRTFANEDDDQFG
jgi:hypothetical protein